MDNDVAWDLTYLFKGYDDPQLREIPTKVNTELEQYVSSYRGAIDVPEMTPTRLRKLLDDYERLLLLPYRLGMFANLSLAANQNDKNAQKLANTAQSLRTTVNTQLSFVKVELGRLLDERLPEFLSAPELQEYTHFLTRRKEEYAHTLSEEEEQLIVEKNQYGINNWKNLQQELVAKRSYTVVVEGKEQTIGFGKSRGLVSHPSREVRREVIDKVMNGLAEDREVYAYCLRSVCGDHLQMSKRRSYDNIRASSYFANDVTASMIESLVTTVEQNVDLFQELLLLKAKELGTDKLLGEDLMTDLSTGETPTFTWEEAEKLVVEAYSSFDKEFGEKARAIFDVHRIDAASRVGKRAGAFCYPDFFNKSAFVLLSFSGTSDNLRTLAHEMGHAIHSTFLGESQPFLNYGVPMVMAETASIFGEMIMFNRLLEGASPVVRKTMLLNQLFRNCTTVFEVCSRVRIEDQFYQTMQAGHFLDADTASKIFEEERRKYFGDAVEWRPNQEYEWCWKPHYYRTDLRYYNYPYVFAALFVFALYAEYRVNGEAFIPKYKELLKAGSSAPPLVLGREIMGIDMADPDFWKMGISEMRNILAEIKELE